MQMYWLIQLGKIFKFHMLPDSLRIERKDWIRRDRHGQMAQFLRKIEICPQKDERLFFAAAYIIAHARKPQHGLAAGKMVYSRSIRSVPSPSAT